MLYEVHKEVLYSSSAHETESKVQDVLSSSPVFTVPVSSLKHPHRKLPKVKLTDLPGLLLLAFLHIDFPLWGPKLPPSSHLIHAVIMPEIQGEFSGFGYPCQ